MHAKIAHANSNIGKAPFRTMQLTYLKFVLLFTKKYFLPGP